MESMKHMNRVNVSTYPEDSINNKNHPDHNKPGFMVRAVKVGNYGVCLRQPGDVFKIKYARHFADIEDPNGHGWMEKVDPKGQKPARRQGVLTEARGARKADNDPDGIQRQRRMEKVDEMAEECEELDQLNAAQNEADVI